jgi:hypothetical protein
MKVKLLLIELVDDQVNGRVMPVANTLDESPIIDVKKGTLDLQNWLFQINGTLRPTRFQIAISNASFSGKQLKSEQP